MSFFLTEDQEGLVNEFLDRENRKICEKQLESEEIPEEFKDLIRKTIETDSPLPFFNPGIGYYSISFTPVDKGNRIYIHHHLTNVSEAIYDPSRIVVDDGDEQTDEAIDPEVMHPTAESDYEELKSALPEHVNYDIPENTEEYKEKGYYIPANE
jgi:hypothetical protein